jgi:hypothetical protein
MLDTHTSTRITGFAVNFGDEPKGGRFGVDRLHWWLETERETGRGSSSLEGGKG